MPCAFKVDPQHELVLLRPTGQFTEAEFIEACRACYDHPDREPTFSHVWDARFIDELVMGVDVISEFRDFLEENQERVTEGPVLVIATRSVTETFATMLVQVSELQPATYRLYNRVEAAAEELGIPSDVLTDESGFRRVEP